MKRKILLIGEIIVDVTLDKFPNENKLRLGGIIHPARALWAMQEDYSIGYIAPNYLDNQILEYAKNMKVEEKIKIGNVIGAPNVIIINEPKEIGSQGYELLFREEQRIILQTNELELLVKRENFSDIIIFPGGYELSRMLKICKTTDSRIHIDIANGVTSIDVLSALGKPFDTVILSTSSPIFLEKVPFNQDILKMVETILENYGNSIIFKENRGGTRFFKKENPKNPIYVQAQLRRIAHSVGVGDCFNVAFCALNHKYPEEEALAYSSWIAADYAETTIPDVFKSSVSKTLKTDSNIILNFKGVSLPWEKRKEKNIYIAGPDFDYVDTTIIDEIVNALQYHNFNPRRPIKENSQVANDTSLEDRQVIFSEDLNLLTNCHILVAILINDDPGTLIEIGLAKGIGIPVIVYDPFMFADNLFLTELPDLVSSNLDEIMVKVFQLLSKD